MALPALVILDRDGVINRDSDDYIRSAGEWHPLPGSLAAIAQLTRLGIPVAIATNQSGIGRGYFDRPALYRMHRKLRRLLATQGGKIVQIEYCPHQPDDDCPCRKPAPTLLFRILRRQGTLANQSVMVGDSVKDIVAGQRAGMKTVLVRSGKPISAAQIDDAKPDAVFGDLADYVASLEVT